MSTPTASQRLPNLVLVEDSEDDEFLSVKGIGKSGVECRTEVIRHGGNALLFLTSPTSPRPDLVVLDYQLPGLSGLEILREMRAVEKTKFVPVVILSSLGSDREILACLGCGANSFVQKPVDPQHYIDRMTLIVRYWMTVDGRTRPPSPFPAG